ncbi:hypothetical protein GW750_06650 [bacterium]|nr:hypothetical protein [bacterium]
MFISFLVLSFHALTENGKPHHFGQKNLNTSISAHKINKIGNICSIKNEINPWFVYTVSIETLHVYEIHKSDKLDWIDF